MKVEGQREEIAFIKNAIEKMDFDCNECIYKDGCKEDDSDICADYILRHIVFKEIN